MKAFKINGEPFKVNGKAGKVVLKLPTDVSEITADYLQSCVEHIQPAPEYSVIALCYREKLAIVLNSAKENKNITSSVVPLFVCGGDSESDFCAGLTLGNPVIIAGSDLAMGYQINSPINVLSIGSVVNLCKDDKDIYMEALKDDNYYYFVEFKLIPNCNIHAEVVSTVQNNYDSPFISVETEEEGNTNN